MFSEEGGGLFGVKTFFPGTAETRESGTLNLHFICSFQVFQELLKIMETRS